MPALDRTNLRPQPDDPWRASDHNAVVDQSVALNESFRFEHGDAGDHARDRFPAAGIVAMFDGASWVTVAQKGIASLVSVSATRFTLTLERPMRSAGQLGVIGYSDLGWPIDSLTAGKTRDTVTIRAEAAGKQIVTVYIVGQYEPL